MWFGKKKKDVVADKGVEIIEALVKSLVDLDETARRIEGKVDVIYNVYKDINAPK